MLVSELIGNSVIIKCIVRNDSGYIGSIEVFGEIVKAGQTIVVHIKEGELAGKTWEINVRDAQFSEPDRQSYALGGTGKWVSQRTVYVNGVDFLIEWFIDYSKLENEPDVEEEKPELPEELQEEKPVSWTKKSLGLPLPLMPKTEEEQNNSNARLPWSTNIEDNPVPKGFFGVVRYDSERGYNKLSRVTKDNFEIEEEANEAMADAAREFARLVRTGGHLIDIKRLSPNSIRVEYVDNNGSDSFVIFQIFEG